MQLPPLKTLPHFDNYRKYPNNCIIRIAITVRISLVESIITLLHCVFFVSYVMRCAIWYRLYNFKNVKNTHGGVLFLVKTLLHAYFSRFLNCENCTKSRKHLIYRKVEP